MTISFREIADLSDSYDEETKAIGDSRKDMWAEARAAYSPREVAALKDAIRLRRKRKKDGDHVVDAHDDLVTSILAEISPTIGYARAPNIEEIQGEVGREFPNETPPHDADGVLIEEPAVPESGPAEAGQEGEPERAAGVEPGAKASSVAPPPIPHSAAPQIPADTAAVEASSLPVELAAADLSFEMPDIPPRFDRRKQQEVAA